MRLVEDWKKCWKWFSVQLAALSAVAATVYAAAPEIVAAYVPDGYYKTGMAVLGGLIILGRVIKQND